MMSTCHICKISLSLNDMQSHILGKRHLRNANKDMFFNNGMASMEHQREVERLLEEKTKQKQQVLQNIQQDRQKRKLKVEKTAMPDPKTDVPPADVDKSLPFVSQADKFIQQIRQTEEERQNVQLVLRDVALTFSKVIPNVMPLLYGSQFSGLAFKTSDMDVYLSDPHGGFEDAEFIKHHGRVIYKSRFFTKIVIITRARVPVIKAKHISTGIELDISATSGQAVANSVLIRFLLSHDIRVPRLMMLIGYWAKKCNLISISKFSRYSFNLLTIFYLQYLQPPILPPLCKIVCGIPGKTWPFHVNENRMYLVNENTLPLHELFFGFFEFYHTFPFARYIISPYLGRRILFTDLEKEEILNEMIYYKINIQYNGEKLRQKHICIQDPLELCHNTSKAITGQTITQFDVSCKKMLDMMNNLSPKDWLFEVVNGKVTEPVVIDKPAKDYILRVPYKTDPEWAEQFKKVFCDVLLILGFTISAYVPCDDGKKTKLNSDCMQFLIETTENPFTPDYKNLFNLLKEKAITLEVFKLHIKPEKQPNFLFSALCFITKFETNTLAISFSNHGNNNKMYNKTMFFLLKTINSLIALVIERGKTKENQEMLTENELKSSNINEIKPSLSSEMTDPAAANQDEVESTHNEVNTDSK